MHHYDLWRYLTGAEVEEVSVLSRSALGDDDVVTISARLSSGALVSAVRALEQPGLNHRFVVTGGVLEVECRSVIQKFFWDKRRSERIDVDA